jgi:hypothetical protein
MSIRQAIVVKYLGPTNFRGSRYKATAEAGSIVVDCDNRLNDGENARAAGMALAVKHGWDKYSDFVLGGLPGPRGGYVLVAVDKKDFLTKW